MFNKIKDWLRVMRIQTAPFVVLLGLIPFLAFAEVDILKTVLFVALLFLVEWQAFGHNSLMDTAMGHDTNDPSKGHHPLVSGTISLNLGHRVLHRFTILVIILVIILTITMATNPVLALASAFLAAYTEEMYNDGLSKESAYSFIDVGIAGAALVSWGWFMTHSYIDVNYVLLVIYGFFAVAYDCVVCGHMKDFKFDSINTKSNTLHDFGARINSIDEFSAGKAWIFQIPKIASVLIIIALFLNSPVKTELFSLIATLVLTFFMLSLSLLLFAKKYNRKALLKRMSLAESFTVLVLAFALLPFWIALFLMFSSYFYFFFSNRAVWGSWIQTT